MQYKFTEVRAGCRVQGPRFTSKNLQSWKSGVFELSVLDSDFMIYMASVQDREPQA
jgi:hypothetical protein